MIRKLFLLFVISYLFASCSKSPATGGCGYTESTAVATPTEIATLQAYVTGSHPAAILHSSGIFYEITSAGTGATPSICSTITVKYSGYLTSGFKFDENLAGTNFVLGQLIVGWQKGLPLIKKGGSINLYIPPSLGYGSTPNGNIPANSYLVFAIQLVDVL